MDFFLFNSSIYFSLFLPSSSISSFGIVNCPRGMPDAVEERIKGFKAAAAERERERLSGLVKS